MKSEFTNAIKQINEQTKTESSQLQSIIRSELEEMKWYTEIIAPIFEQIHHVKLYIEQLLSNSEISFFIKTILQFNKAQYIYWDYLPRSLIDRVLDNNDTDRIINDWESKKDYASSEAIISECANHKYFASCRTLFKQSISNYYSKSYYIAALGLSAVIDAILTEASNMITHRPLKRCQAILDKLKGKKAVDNSEYSFLTLYITFNATFESFYKSIPFSDEEPAFLNRHWIVHGRSTRKFSQLDCIKLIRLLRGIIILSEMGSTNEE